MKDTKKAILSWTLYDWANSAFATTVMAGFFPVFFKAYWSTETSVQVSTFYLGAANSIAAILIAIMAPILGAIADKQSAKKRFLGFFTFLGTIMTGGLWIVQAGQWQMAILFYIVGTIGFSGGNIFYDALLPSVASERKVDYVSSLGFALGYIGGGVLFVINVLMYLKPEIFGIPDGATGIRLSFISVALWWIVFSLPIMIFVKEPKDNDSMPISKAVGAGWKQLKRTISEIRHLKIIGTFLLAYWFYIDGVDTIIKMAIDFGISLGFPSKSLIVALLLVQFIAFPSALIYHRFAQKIGVKRAIQVAISAYAIITVLGSLMQTPLHFYLLAIMIGLFQGGIQALSRSYYTRLIPKNKAAEFFGFYNMIGKFATIIGPFMIGIITVITKSNRVGMLSTLILFLAGAILLRKVDEEEGKKMVTEYLEN